MSKRLRITFLFQPNQKPNVSSTRRFVFVEKLWFRIYLGKGETYLCDVLKAIRHCGHKSCCIETLLSPARRKNRWSSDTWTRAPLLSIRVRIRTLYTLYTWPIYLFIYRYRKNPAVNTTVHRNMSTARMTEFIIVIVTRVIMLFWKHKTTITRFRVTVCFLIAVSKRARASPAAEHRLPQYPGGRGRCSDVHV